MFRCCTFQLQLCSSQVHYTCCDSPSPVPPLLLLPPSQHCGSPHSASDTFFGKDSGKKIGGLYMKVIYREYTDATFTIPATTSPPLGLLGERSVISWGFVACVFPSVSSLRFSICPGPVLRGEQGDTLRVTLLNKADRPCSIQPHGVHYDKHFQGSSYDDGEEPAL